MTVIVGIEKEGVVYMGADTCTSWGKNKENKAKEEFGKIVLMPNGLLVGISGMVSAHQILTAHTELFSFADDQLTKEGIVRSFLPAVIKTFDEKQLLEKDSDLPISMMMAKGKDLFVITSSKNTFRVRNYGIGSGRDYAFIALCDEKETVENRLLNGMRLATEFDTGVKAPYVLVDTKEKTFREVQE